MHADLDTLLTTVYCMADDLLPCKPDNARRRVTDAEVVTLCVAPAIMGVPEDPRFLARADNELRHLFPQLPQQPGYWKRRRRLVATIERLVAIFAAECPGAGDFCKSPMVRWAYPAEREWRACERCHAAVDADDRKTLLERVMLQPIPRTLDDRHAGRFRDRARELHELFWQTRSGPARPA